MTRGGADGCPAVALDLRLHPLHVCPDAGALMVHVTLALSAIWQRNGILQIALRLAAGTHFASDCDSGGAAAMVLYRSAISMYDGVHRETLCVDRTYRLPLTLVLAS
jgi:hypothetical protein